MTSVNFVTLQDAVNCFCINIEYGNLQVELGAFSC